MFLLLVLAKSLENVKGLQSLFHRKLHTGTTAS